MLGNWGYLAADPVPQPVYRPSTLGNVKVSFPVEYQSRFSRVVESQIVFTSRREGHVHAAAMNFKLRSRCTGRKRAEDIHYMLES